MNNAVSETIGGHGYSWLARHRGVYCFMTVYFLWVVVSFIKVIFIDEGLKYFKFVDTVDVLILFLLLGLASDLVTGVIRKGDQIIVTSDGLVIYLNKKRKTYIAWEDIACIDEFDIHEKTNEKQTDYWKAMGIGGMRLTTKSGDVFRVYRTIKSYGRL